MNRLYEINEAFDLLTAALLKRRLPKEKGGSRVATADEFAFMGQSMDGLNFRHIYTNNYLFVKPNGKLSIPSSNDFSMRGFFDTHGEDDE